MFYICFSTANVLTRSVTDLVQYHAQLGLHDKGRAIKGLVVCNDWDLEPLDLLNGMALGCLVGDVFESRLNTSSNSMLTMVHTAAMSGTRQKG